MIPAGKSDQARSNNRHPGYVWTFLDEARDPGQIGPGAIVIAGDEDTAAICQVVDLVPAGDGTIVHLRPLPVSSRITRPS